MNLIPFAFSFPTWKCNRCRCEVEWLDAVVVDTPEVFQVIHRDCYAD